MSLEQKQGQEAFHTKDYYVAKATKRIEQIEKGAKSILSKYPLPVLVGCFTVGFLAARLQDMWD